MQNTWFSTFFDFYHVFWLIKTVFTLQQLFKPCSTVIRELKMSSYAVVAQFDRQLWLRENRSWCQNSRENSLRSKFRKMAKKSWTIAISSNVNMIRRGTIVAVPFRTTARISKKLSARDRRFSGKNRVFALIFFLWPSSRKVKKSKKIIFCAFDAKEPLNNRIIDTDSIGRNRTASSQKPLRVLKNAKVC